MVLKKIILFLVCLAIPLGVGFLSGHVTAGQTETWFTTINKPAFNPPNWLFAPVWTLLYTLMGISLYMIWTSPKNWPRQKSILIFFTQLFFNFWWSLIFFAFHLLFAAVVDIAILLLLIVYMINTFKQVKPAAAYLNIPYLLWVTFATVLTISIWCLN